MMRISIIAGSLMGFLVSQAHAESVCETYIGQSIAAQRLQTIVSSYSKIPAKGEFETTTAFNERRKAALGITNAPIVIAVPPQRDPAFIYDADKRLLQVQTVGFGGHIIQPSGIAVAAPNMPAYGVNNIDAVVERSNKTTGSYVGQNAFGAKTSVTKRDVTTLGIFDRPDPNTFLTDYRINYLFDTIDQKHYVVGGIPMSPQEAMTTKASLRNALVVSPKEPFLVQGTRSTGEVTIDNPDDVTEHFSILVADIQCGLVLDSKNKVIAAYETRSTSMVDTVAKIDGNMEPVLRTHTQPPYPTVSFRLGEQGVTELKVIIDTEGSVKEASVKTSSGSQRLDQAALDYVRSHWRWKPPSKLSETTATVTWDPKKAQ